MLKEISKLDFLFQFTLNGDIIHQFFFINIVSYLSIPFHSTEIVSYVVKDFVELALLYTLIGLMYTVHTYMKK